MIKEEFINKMLALYASNSTHEHRQALYDMYYDGLSDNTKFAELYQKVITENKSKSAPQLANLLEIIRVNGLYKYKEIPKEPVYWTIWAKTKYGVYEFANELSVKLEEGKEIIKKRGFEYIKDNRDDVIKRLYGQ